MIYIDTSIIIAILARESEALRASAALSSVDFPATSDWVVTEVASALSLKARIGQLAAQDVERALGTFLNSMKPDMTGLEIERADFQRAADLIVRTPLPLRSGDALHLAVADRNGAGLLTLDKRFAAAARAVGVDIIEP